MNEKNDSAQENGFFSITDAYQRSDNNKKGSYYCVIFTVEHVYSVDTIRSIRHSSVHKDMEVITYVYFNRINEDVEGDFFHPPEFTW